MRLIFYFVNDFALGELDVYWTDRNGRSSEGGDPFCVDWAKDFPFDNYAYRNGGMVFRRAVEAVYAMPDEYISDGAIVRATWNGSEWKYELLDDFPHEPRWLGMVRSDK